MANEPKEQEQILEAMARLREEHDDLDSAVEALDANATTDLPQIQRLKKKKLLLKDQLASLERELSH